MNAVWQQPSSAKTVNHMFDRKYNANCRFCLAWGREERIESKLLLSFYPLFMTYVVASKIKEFINAKGMMSAGDLAEHASKALEEMLAKAVKRAAANGRKTVRGEDL
jgi:hypothetical protein